MGLDLRITDMAGARPEHSAVIVNFVSAIREQLFQSRLRLECSTRIDV